MSHKSRRKKKVKEEVAPSYSEAPGEKPTEAPPEQKPRELSNEERVYAYLTEYGAAGPLRIAKALGLERSEVIKALKSLQKEGKVHLR